MGLELCLNPIVLFDRKSAISQNSSMGFLRQISRWIDLINEGIGRLTFGFALVMVVVGAYNTLARYLGKYIGVNLSSNRYIEVQWYLFSLIFLLGAAYVLKHGSHVRVDIIYSHLSRKGKAWVDLFGSALLLLPMCVVFFLSSTAWVKDSWLRWEMSSNASGLPLYPLKTAFLVAFVLLALQGISEIIKQIEILLTPNEPPSELQAEGED